jgi:hypothetical protein
MPKYTMRRSLKLYLYKKIKHDIVLEEYLIKEKNFKNRQLMAKFRTSDHCLQIETGVQTTDKRSEVGLSM